MACEYIKSDWNWKRGDKLFPFSSIDVIGTKSQFNYFTCGTPYFDGEYFVVKFPKGMQLYHGSGPLANSLVEFPLGKEFYQRVDIGTTVPADIVAKIRSSDLSIERILSENMPISMSWYGDLSTAQIYSSRADINPYVAQCGDRCLFVYELIQDAVFLQLDNDYNITKILANTGVPFDVKTALSQMFNIRHDSPDVIESSENKFGEFTYREKRRRSYFTTDRLFSTWLCDDKSMERYAGYAANIQVIDKKEIFHMEFMFCNPLNYMRRNLLNVADWQYNDLGTKTMYDIVRKFLKQLSYYKSYNVNFHAGNLFEHSVWSLLFAEVLSATADRLFNVSLSAAEQKEVAAIAFIHDIGKMTITDPKVTVRKHDVVFSSLPSHPKLGGDYIRGDKQLPVLDGDMKQIGFLDVNLLLDALGLSDMNRHELAKIVDLHWQFGAAFRRISDDSFPSLDLAADIFINVCGVNESVKFYAYLVIVSMADILASQPYGMNNLTVELNHRSKFFPFIANVPKKYRGGNVADLNADRRVKFATLIMDKIKTANIMTP